MGMLDEEPGVNAANEAAQPDHPRASSPRPVPCFEPGPASWKHAPTAERCFRQEPPGRKRPPAFTLCYKVSGPFRAPSALSQWTQGKEMEMIENCQNRAGCSGVYRFQITTYDKKLEVQRGP
jgi:hypothetical protein